MAGRCETCLIGRASADIFTGLCRGHTLTTRDEPGGRSLYGGACGYATWRDLWLRFGARLKFRAGETS